MTEYIGIACPTCYKPIVVPEGYPSGLESSRKFCGCDNSNWVLYMPDPHELFEIPLDETWTGPVEGSVYSE